MQHTTRRGRHGKLLKLDIQSKQCDWQYAEGVMENHPNYIIINPLHIMNWMIERSVRPVVKCFFMFSEEEWPFKLHQMSPPWHICSSASVVFNAIKFYPL